MGSTRTRPGASHNASPAPPASDASVSRPSLGTKPEPSPRAGRSGSASAHRGRASHCAWRAPNVVARWLAVRSHTGATHPPCSVRSVGRAPLHPSGGADERVSIFGKEPCDMEAERRTTAAVGDVLQGLELAVLPTGWTALEAI